MTMFKKLLALSVLFFSLTVFANGQALIGKELVLPKLANQFDQHTALSNETKWVVFSHDKASSKIVKAAFEKHTNSTLKAANIQYYADISGMPGFISRFVAIPRMKKLPYSVVMGQEDDELAHLPKEEDKVSLIQVENGKVVQVIIAEDAQKILATVF